MKLIPSHNGFPRSPVRCLVAGFAALIWIAISVVSPLSQSKGQEISFSLPAESHPVTLTAQEVSTWKQGGYDVFHLSGKANISQNWLTVECQEAVVLRQFVDDEHSRQKLIIYAEGQVNVSLPPGAGEQSGDNRLTDERWFGRTFTVQDLRIPAHIPITKSDSIPEIFARASAAIEVGGVSGVQQVQFQQAGPAAQTLISPLTGQIQTINPEPLELYQTQRPVAPQDTPTNQSLAPERSTPARRSGQTQVDFQARDSLVPLNFKRDPNPNNPNELIYLLPGGVRVAIDSPEISGANGLGGDGGRTLVILADNAVGWETTLPNGDTRWELYLEGNVVFQKGTRVIYADQMYYDATTNHGTILNADMLTPVSNYNGLVRLKAKVIEQVDDNQLNAIGAAFTSSRIGVPRYWLQSDRIEINRMPTAQLDATTNRPVFNSLTGQVETTDEYFAESAGNYLYVSDRPVFYWPRFRTNLNDPSIYLEQLRFGNDRIFGFQAHTAWDLHQILGFRNRPENSRWLGIVDYLSDRGVGFGSELDYARQSLFGLPGTAEGYYRGWFINDSGTDNLGRGRTALVPEKEFRGNSLLRHRSRFEPGYSLRAEFGYLSDRNFLEQYYERRWDTEKDYTTGLWLERNIGTQSFNAIANYQLNEFFTQTSWLPRLDHFVIGQPLLGDRVVWHNHSHVGYGRFRPATAPLDPVDLAPFDWTAWEASGATGVRAGTRQEFDLPFQVGPVKVVPYVLGDVTYWQEDLAQNDLLRGYGQVGLRTSLPIWKVDPTIQSTLLNVNGLAHKIAFESEVLFADASKDLANLPLYDQLDDDSQEAFRHRFVVQYLESHQVAMFPCPTTNDISPCEAGCKVG
ncbi:MAG: hypothetical protein R3C03_15730 [Pirellulaceae bacterium]